MVYSLLCNVMSCIVILCACGHSFMYSIKDMFAEIKHIVLLTEEALLGEKQIVASWSQTSHWGEWWTRLPQLQMLTQVFSHQYADWHGIPRNTNGVERINHAGQ